MPGREVLGYTKEEASSGSQGKGALGVLRWGGSRGLGPGLEWGTAGERGWGGGRTRRSRDFSPGILEWGESREAGSSGRGPRAEEPSESWEGGEGRGGKLREMGVVKQERSWRCGGDGLVPRER